MSPEARRQVPMQATTIDEVIRSLDEIVAWSYQHDSRLGYFACLYRRVTLEVRSGIAEGFFQDARRMEELDVRFANRYLAAVEQFWRSEQATSSWQAAFDAAPGWRPVILQHMLLGMNAHIYLDLGIAAAQTVPPDQLEGLHGDFLRINDILSRLVDDTQRRLRRVWPAVGPLGWLAGDADNVVIDLAMQQARDRSWSAAQQLAALPPSDHPSYINQLDTSVARRARIIMRPGFTLSSLLLFVRLRERGNIANHLDALR